MILITGGDGQLGRTVCSMLTRHGISHVGLGRNELDVTDICSVKRGFDAYKPDVVLHCAAFSKVDLAEERRDLCYRVNAEGTELVARESEKNGAYLLYISSDYVFDGEKAGAYETFDSTNPISVYGKSKAEGEQAALACCKNSAVLRTSWLFGQSNRNFVEAILRAGHQKRVLDVVCDQIGSPTYTEDLVKLIMQMVEQRSLGIYHGTNEGVCSWAQFAREILQMVGSDTVVREITSEEYASRARRPRNSILSKNSLDKAGFAHLPHWRDALNRYLNKRKEFDKSWL